MSRKTFWWDLDNQWTAVEAAKTVRATFCAIVKIVSLYSGKLFWHNIRVSCKLFLQTINVPNIFHVASKSISVFMAIRIWPLQIIILWYLHLTFGNRALEVEKICTLNEMREHHFWKNCVPVGNALAQAVIQSWVLINHAAIKKYWSNQNWSVTMTNSGMEWN